MPQESNTTQSTSKESTNKISKKFDKEYGRQSTPIELLKIARLALNGRVGEFYDFKGTSRDYVEKMFNVNKLGGYLPQIFDITSNNIDFKKRNRHIYVNLTDFDSIITNISTPKERVPVGNLTFIFDIPTEMIQDGSPIDPKNFDNLLSNAFKRIPGKYNLSDEILAEILVTKNQINTGISSFGGEDKTTDLVIKLSTIKK
jgi:hypothetical protein